jgi:hypothetical protein
MTNVRASAHSLGEVRLKVRDLVRRPSRSVARVFLSVLVGVALLVSAWLLIEGPVAVLDGWRGQLGAKDLLELENTYRQTYAQVIGGAILAIGAYVGLGTL